MGGLDFGGGGGFANMEGVFLDTFRFSRTRTHARTHTRELVFMKLLEGARPFLAAD